MDTSALHHAIQNLPDSPGVYFFRDKDGVVLYIGKATSLKSRVKSYLAPDLSERRGEFIVRMMDEARTVSVVETDSALEALILEAKYIKEQQPKYNSREKDNKSFNYVVITKEPFPRVLVRRGRELEKLKGAVPVWHLFGPFASGSTLREAVKLIRKIFPFRDKCTPQSELRDPSKARPCFNHQIGLCPGVCVGVVTKEEYACQVRHIIQFFKGKKRRLLKELEREMNEHARTQEFEKAEQVKRQIHALEHIRDVSLLTRDFSERKREKGIRIEGYDVAHLGGDDTVGVMTVLVDGQAEKDQYRKFTVRSATRGNDVAALEEILTRRMAHPEWGNPGLIVVDGGVAQKRRAEKVVKHSDIDAPVVSVVKDERHRPRDILGQREIIDSHREEILKVNAEAHRFALSFNRSRSRSRRFR